MNRFVISEPWRGVWRGVWRTGCSTARLAASFALSAIGAASALAPAALAAEAQAPVVLVFWTAGDCVWCKVWKTGDRHQEFQTEATRLGVHLVTMAKPSLRDPDSAYRGPDEGQLASPGPSIATSTAPKMLPSFDFMCQGKSVRRLVGLAEWDSFWRSQLRKMARDCTTTPRS